MYLVWQVITVYILASAFIPLGNKYENKACYYQSYSQPIDIPEYTSGLIKMELERRAGMAPKSYRLVGCKQKDFSQVVLMRINPLTRFQSIFGE
ncbi:MAG: hypothetical protein N5P05_004132 (plasmid) [Chroococcopsis gigantea SAG 12.99]|jgi:hypothetical protein|nr:hypothetical protein [Chroococcopsis gigantea SAG 12.99]